MLVSFTNNINNMITTINEYKINESNDSYTRKIPRDFFNESKLLKCMGQLSLHIINNTLPEGIDIKIEESGESFNIRRNDYDGSIYVANYYTIVNNEEVQFKTQLNSKSSYPMYCDIEDEDIEVFNNDGSFSEDFMSYFIETHPIKESNEIFLTHIKSKLPKEIVFKLNTDDYQIDDIKKIKEYLNSNNFTFNVSKQTSKIKLMSWTKFVITTDNDVSFKENDKLSKDIITKALNL